MKEIENIESVIGKLQPIEIDKVNKDTLIMYRTHPLSKEYQAGNEVETGFLRSIYGKRGREFFIITLRNNPKKTVSVRADKVVEINEDLKNDYLDLRDKIGQMCDYPIKITHEMCVGMVEEVNISLRGNLYVVVRDVETNLTQVVKPEKLKF